MSAPRAYSALVNEQRPTTPPPSEPPAQANGQAGDVTSRYPAGSPPPAMPPTPPPAGPPVGLSGSSRLQLHVVAHALALPLIVLGVITPLDESMMLRTVTVWAVFALLAALTQIAPLLDLGESEDQRWVIGGAGTAALAIFWWVVVEPGATSNTGFILTMGVVAAAVGTFTSPHRRWPAVHGR